MRLDVAWGERCGHGQAVGSGFHRRALEDIAAEEIDRLVDGLHILAADFWDGAAVSLQAVLGIASEDDGIAQPRVVPDGAGEDGKGGFACGFGVGGRFRVRIENRGRGRPADRRWFHCVGADGLDGPAVREECVVGGQEDFGQLQLQARGVLTGAVAHADEALRIGKGDPVLHPVGELAYDGGDVILKPRRAVGIQPSAAQEKVIRIIPMKQGDPGIDAGGEELVDEAVVEIEALLVDRASPGGMTRGQEMEKR